MARTLQKRASKKTYISPSQLTLMSFETPISEHLDSLNMWVRLANEIPWDSIVNVYLNQLNNHATGASNINPRVILGALMLKHMQNISDDETIQMIRKTFIFSTSLASTVSHRKRPSIPPCSWRYASAWGLNN
jgi:hypothetical protein